MFQERKKRILIVDDKSVNRYILKDIFEDAYDVWECQNGMEAIQALDENPDDTAVILLDIVMPTYDGFSVLNYMKEQNLQSSVPVVLVSSNVNDENIRKAYEYEVADYIQKPFQDEVVRFRVEKVIEMFKKRENGLEI